MPIYSYRCETCGFRQDVLRKMSDPLLVDCPSCNAATFVKQVTAAGFQLKGSGWYVTDFRNPAGKESAKSSDKAGDADGTKTGGKDEGSAPAAAGAESGAAPAKPSAAPGSESKAAPTSTKAAPAPTTGSS